MFESALALLESLLAFWGRPFSSMGSYGATVLLALKAAVLTVALWLAAKLAGRIVRARVLDRTKLGEGHKFAFQRILGYALFGFGALTGLHAIGVDLTSITVFSGALGIGLGLGFQTITKDFASGLILLLEQPIKVGDRVDVGELHGSIVTIGSRATCVRTNDNVEIIVPNSEFIEGRVTNLTLNDRNVRIHVPFGVSYGSDADQVRAVAMRAGHEHPDVLETPAPDALLVGFGESSLDFELRAWTAKQVSTPQVIVSDLNYGLLAAFRAEGIEIPFPLRDLYLKSAAGIGGQPQPGDPPGAAREEGATGEGGANAPQAAGG